MTMKISNNINEDDTSEEIVAFEEDEFLDLHDEAQEAAPPVPVVVPENVPTIEVVPENKLGRKRADDAELEAKKNQKMNQQTMVC